MKQFLKTLRDYWFVITGSVAFSVGAVVFVTRFYDMAISTEKEVISTQKDVVSIKQDVSLIKKTLGISDSSELAVKQTEFTPAKL